MQVGCPSKLREAPVALKALYDADLAEEDIILAWADRADAAKVLGVSPDEASAVRKGVEQVVQWLQEAESDEDDDDEEEDDEDDE
jgi:translation initiation factor 5